MKPVTSNDIRQFLLVKYSGTIEALGPAEPPDDFDLLLNGVIDSFGILEMISANRRKILDTTGSGAVRCGANHNSWPAVAVCSGKC